MHICIYFACNLVMLTKETIKATPPSRAIYPWLHRYAMQFITGLVFIHFLFAGISNAGMLRQNLTDTAPSAIRETSPCGTPLYRLLEEKKYPEIQIYRKLQEEKTHQFISKLKSGQQSTALITIPVVVHVVFSSGHPRQNISNEQIYSQIEALNRDFRRWNPDTLHTPEIFRSLAADTQIEFKLARRTPEGFPSNGITRTMSQHQDFTLETDKVKHTNLGGKSIWNRDEYLNIWVCNLQEGLLGYAQYPGGRSDTDGIVISYRAFGTEGTATPPNHMGRTLAHEVGHWLNLMHTWGDEDTCDATDYVDDTPWQKTAYFHCPEFPQISCGSKDMFMNYMDYTNDACMNLFTIGQKQRMHATLNGFRASIKNSGALQPGTTTGLYCHILNQNLYDSDLWLHQNAQGEHITGSNTQNPGALAQLFTMPHDQTHYIKGGTIAFGDAHDAGGSAYVALWLAGSQNRPIGSPIVKKKIALAEIATDVHNQRYTSFDFEIPVQINGSFFMGIILPDEAANTLALKSSQFSSNGNAWLQDNLGQWQRLELESGERLDLAVFPNACQKESLVKPQQNIKMHLGPNPLRENVLNLYFNNYPSATKAKLDIVDIRGRLIYHRVNLELEDHIKILLPQFETTGLLIIRVYNNEFHLNKKIIHTPIN